MSGDRPFHLILGAGVAGLAAAYHIGRRARASGGPVPRIVVVEADSRPGGLAVSLSRDGVVTDLGPHRLHTELPEVAALLGEVAEERLLTVRRESHMYWLGARLTYPIRAAELPLRLGLARTARLASGALLARAGLARGPAAPDSFATVMRARFGGPLWRELLSPYSAKVWKCDPESIHGDIARVRISAGGVGEMARRLFAPRGAAPARPSALTSFRYPRGGLQTLVDILADKVREVGGEVVLDAPVTALRTTTLPDGRRTLASITAGGRTFERPDAVISTIPLPTLGDLLGAPWRAPCSRLEYLAMRLVVVVVRRDRITRDNWLYFFDRDAILNRAYEAKNFDPELAPAGRSALTCEVTCRLGDDLWSLPDDTLTERTLDALVGNGLFARDEVETAFVHPVEWAYPVYQLDYRDRLAAAYEQLGRIDNLLTCGRQGLFNHNNTDHSMSMGMAAAEAILRGEAAPARGWYAGLVERFAHFRIVD